jgi:flagellar motor switch protein FliN/FliY
VDRVSGVELDGMWTVALAPDEDRSKASILLCLDGELLDSLPKGDAAQTATESESAFIDPSSLKLVLDVELNVSLRFGQCQMPLSNVLELASGSVIELDRAVDEPVELILDGKVIARGEAVIVDGNYGLRVIEIPEPLQSRFLN